MPPIKGQLELDGAGSAGRPSAEAEHEVGVHRRRPYTPINEEVVRGRVAPIAIEAERSLAVSLRNIEDEIRWRRNGLEASLEERAGPVAKRNDEELSKARKRKTERTKTAREQLVKEIAEIDARHMRDVAPLEQRTRTLNLVDMACTATLKKVRRTGDRSELVFLPEADLFKEEGVMDLFERYMLNSSIAMVGTLVIFSKDQQEITAFPKIGGKTCRFIMRELLHTEALSIQAENNALTKADKEERTAARKRAIDEMTAAEQEFAQLERTVASELAAIVVPGRAAIETELKGLEANLERRRKLAQSEASSAVTYAEHRIREELKLANRNARSGR